MKVALYFRVSTSSQTGEDRFGLAAQREAVALYCKARGYEVVAEYEDAGFSGASAERPGLATMLHDAAHENNEGRKPPFDAVIVAKGDRLAREVMLDGYLRFTLKKMGVEVLSASEETVGDDPMNALLQTMLAAFAQFERALITARLVGGRRAKKASGGYADGRPRYGMRAADGALIEDAQEAQVVSVMLALRKKGNSVRAIADHLNEQGLKPRHGSVWRSSTVHNVLKRLAKPRTSRKKLQRGTNAT